MVHTYPLQGLFYVALLMGWLGLDGCTRPYVPPPPTTGDVYRPVYASYDEIRRVQTLAPQPIKNPGKIYVLGTYLLINEVGSGIHVVDNRDPASPVPISFIAIPGNHELAVKDSILYADNTLDLVALSMANPRQIRLVKRIQNAFPYSSYPLASNVRFECADPSRGVVIRWEKAPVENPRCYR